MSGGKAEEERGGEEKRAAAVEVIRPRVEIEFAATDDLSLQDPSKGGTAKKRGHGDVVVERVIGSGRYEIHEPLGLGGFATVYRGFDRALQREIAVKVLDLEDLSRNNAGTTSTLLERFQREAQFAARIAHPNVVNVFDIGLVDNDKTRPFIVMERLWGFDLEALLERNQPMHPDRLIPLFVHALDALGQAHLQGIVHKDLKPSNLFLSNPGQRHEMLRVLDFGVAHVQTPHNRSDHREGPDSSRLTAVGQVLGTAQYMPPEYISEQIVTPALDVYQLGMILAEVLSGRHLVTTESPLESMRIHTYGRLELPEHLLGTPMEPILRRCLRRDHEARFPNATALAQALATLKPNSIPPHPEAAGPGRSPAATPAGDGTGRGTRRAGGERLRRRRPRASTSLPHTRAPPGADAARGSLRRRGSGSDRPASPHETLRHPPSGQR